MKTQQLAVVAVALILGLLIGGYVAGNSGGSYTVKRISSSDTPLLGFYRYERRSGRTWILLKVKNGEVFSFDNSTWREIPEGNGVWPEQTKQAK